ncbi:MAG: hypothetical protein WHS43_04045 [Aquificaceae bacterium]|jgi:hypothetical protein|uniref:hypothetical protein n=1 Tax=Hydrogenobacter sp. Uz 6-8 TaxID=3384828 RepID=UPI000F174864|nr:MAG: hypothetical protein D6804_07100 [Aquificota bacterium]
MKMLLGFILLFLFAGFLGMLVFLNQQKVVLVLTPAYRGIYYMVPEMSLGLLVVLSFLLGILTGYVLALISRLLKHL